MINFPIQKIVPLASGFAPLNEKQQEQLNMYANLLVEWNEKMNLTAITEPQEVVFKHFLDCLQFFSSVSVPENAKIIDVGTGAGFPGLVLKIARPDIELTLLDSLNKRITFLNEVIEKLELRGVTTIHARAEEGARKNELREGFDIAAARAVAPLNVLSEYCLPYVKVGGEFVAMKGPAAESEVENAKKAISLLGGGEPTIYNKNVECVGERNIIIIKKISQTPPKYPRNSAKISKQPL